MNDGYYLMIDAKKLWLADNPSKTDREFFREGVNVQDEYTEKAGGKKVRYLGAGAPSSKPPRAAPGRPRGPRAAGPLPPRCGPES